MPPLDMGSPTHTLRLIDPLDERTEPAAADYPHIGAYLKATREHRGKSLAEISAATRISRSYLTALEEGNFAVLPSRPFATGYVRAYAKVLELDEDAAAARYRTETPDGAAVLQPPIGVRHQAPERRPLILGLAGLAVIAVVAWNVVQRAVVVDEPSPPLPTVLTSPDTQLPSGPIALGAPTPVPADQTTPAPYITPGLGVNPAAPVDPNARVSLLTPVLDRSAPVVFATRATVHGVPAVGPTVVLFAKKPAALIVRGPAGAVHFARQLAVGEAYRAPIGQKLIAEMTEPGAFALYINNQLQGQMAAPIAPLDTAVAEALANQPAPPPMPAPVAAAQPAPVQAAPAPARPAAAFAPRPAAVQPAAPRPAAVRPAQPRPAAAAPVTRPAPAVVAPAEPAAAASQPAAEPPLF